MSDFLPKKCCWCDKLFIPILKTQQTCLECLMEDEEECEDIEDYVNSLDLEEDWMGLCEEKHERLRKLQKNHEEWLAYDGGNEWKGKK